METLVNRQCYLWRLNSVIHTLQSVYECVSSLYFILFVVSRLEIGSCLIALLLSSASGAISRKRPLLSYTAYEDRFSKRQAPVASVSQWCPPMGALTVTGIRQIVPVSDTANLWSVGSHTMVCGSAIIHSTNSSADTLSGMETCVNNKEDMYDTVSTDVTNANSRLKIPPVTKKCLTNVRLSTLTPAGRKLQSHAYGQISHVYMLLKTSELA